MKVLLNKPELILQLQNLLKDIDYLCSEYDDGNTLITNAIAEKIALIFYSEQSKSLIAQLKLSHFQLFCTSETYDFKSLTNFIGLLTLKHQPGKGWGYFSKLDYPLLTKVAQENWWNSKKVIVDSSGTAYSRAKVVKVLAGISTINLDTSGWKLKDADGNLSTINPLPETVRQIAYELLGSFKGIDLGQESKLHYNRK